VEGKYYVWTAAELRAALSPEDFEFIRTVYAIDEASRWTEEIPDANVLMRWKSDETLARSLDRTDEALHLELTRIHVQLRTFRNERVAPGLDDKILTAWTALAASGLVATGTAFERPEDIERAQEAVDFLLETQRDENGRLRHV